MEVKRDVKERGRDVDGCIKQWMSFVKPNFQRFVQPQRDVAGQQPPTDHNTSVNINTDPEKI